MPVLEEHVGLSRHTGSISGERDDSDHPFQNLVRQERVGFHPLQNLDAAERGGKGSEPEKEQMETDEGEERIK